MKKDTYTPAAQLAGTAERTFPTAEYQKASLVLMHTPGGELFNGVIHPAAALFEDCMDVDAAIDEHRGYIDMLRTRAGACVVTVKQVLQGTPREQLVEFASQFLTYDKTELSFDEGRGVEEYRRKVLQSMAVNDLIRVILQRPVVHLRTHGRNTGWRARVWYKPLTNLFFMRDQMIVTPRGPVVSHMYSPQRNREADIVEFCLRQMGIPPVHRLHGEGSFLEGGDYIPFGSFAFIGRGLRTTQAAIEELMQADMLGHTRIAVVKDRHCVQAQMHLDTYFNVIDRDLAVLSADRYDARPSDRRFLTVDIYDKGAQGYARTAANVPFLSFLADCGIKVIRVGMDDWKHYGTNFLCVGARHVMAVAGQSAALQKTLADNGVTAEWVPLDNLIKGYGAAHCMTQVIFRT